MFGANRATILHHTTSISKHSKMRFQMSHVTYEFHPVSKTIFEPMVRSVKTMHLSCVKLSTICK
jgi:hypothetical protein